MKKILFLAAALLTAGMVSAQVTYSIGYLGKTQTTEVTALGVTVTDSDSKNGFSIGVDDNINLATDFNVAIGGTMEFYFDKDGDYKYSEFNLAVPVDFNYVFGLGSNLKLSVFAGPTLNLGIISKKTGPNDYKYNYYDEDNGNFGRFDVLLGGGAWLDIQEQFRVKVGYKAGMIDRCKSDGTTVKNNVLSVSLGYIF